METSTWERDLEELRARMYRLIDEWVDGEYRRDAIRQSSYASEYEL